MNQEDQDQIDHLKDAVRSLAEGVHEAIHKDEEYNFGWRQCGEEPCFTINNRL